MTDASNYQEPDMHLDVWWELHVSEERSDGTELTIWEVYSRDGLTIGRVEGDTRRDDGRFCWHVWFPSFGLLLGFHVTDSLKHAVEFLQERENARRKLVRE
jgi:hypothetical protein